MKLTYDNLDGVYLAKNGDFRKKIAYYNYADSCAECGDPYLDHKKKPSKYCSHSCSAKNKSEETKEKMRKSHPDVSGSNNPMYGKRFFGASNPNYRGGYNKRNLAAFDTYHDKLFPIEKTRRNPDDDKLLQVRCAYCNNWFTPKLHSVSDRVCYINGTKPQEGRFYCSSGCKISCPIYNKSLHPKGFKETTSREVQPDLRKLVLERDNWACQKCGKTTEDAPLHCHHITGVVQNPIESADMDNCITLCKDCHKYVHKLPGCSYYELSCGAKSGDPA